MTVPAAVLTAAEGQLSGAGSTLRLSAVTLPEVPAAGELTGTMSVEADGSKTIDSPAPWLGLFAVTSGPCAVSDGGRCVGRAGGYLPSERCVITVAGDGGVLGDCGVFDMDGRFDTRRGHYDYITLPDGSTHTGSDCPVGAALSPGGSVGWTSDGNVQGSVGIISGGTAWDNGCAAKGTCGLAFSSTGLLGGGWQICFV